MGLVLRQLSAYDLFLRHWGYRPAEPSLLALFTSMFLHGGWLHLIGNMLFLWIYGDNVEHRLGRLGYLAAYLLTGMLAAVVYGLFVRGAAGYTPMVGASGAISGVLGFYFLWFPRNRVRLLVLFIPFIFTWQVSARLVLAFYLHHREPAPLPALAQRSGRGRARRAPRRLRGRRARRRGPGRLAEPGAAAATPPSAGPRRARPRRTPRRSSPPSSRVARSRPCSPISACCARSGSRVPAEVVAELGDALGRRRAARRRAGPVPSRPRRSPPRPRPRPALSGHRPDPAPRQGSARRRLSVPARRARRRAERRGGAGCPGRAGRESSASRSGSSATVDARPGGSVSIDDQTASAARGIDDHRGVDQNHLPPGRRLRSLSRPPLSRRARPGRAASGGARCGLPRLTLNQRSRC